MKKDYKWFTVKYCFGAIICIFLLCLTIFFTPNFVANNFSPDGALEQFNIVRINLIRTEFGILGIIGLLSILLYFIKGKSFCLLKIQNSKIPLIIELLILADLALSFIYLYSYDVHFMKVFNLDNEASLSTWYSSIQLFCISVLSGLFAYSKFNRLDIRSWVLLLLPLLFLTLSMDESVSIHEWLGQATDFIVLNASREETVFMRTGVWMFVIGGPFLIFYTVLIYSIKKYFDNKNYLLILFGMWILLSGALGVELAGNFVSYKLYYIEIFCEELLEMVGATIIFWGFYNLTDVNLHSVLKALNEQTSK